MREPRIAVMILGEACWEDASGTMQRMPVWMEDKSAGGACLRVKTRVCVGARVKVHCRHEQFTGVSKYCRDDGKEFLVGIQRDSTDRKLNQQPAEIAPLSLGAASVGDTGPQDLSEPVVKQTTQATAAKSPDKPAIAARELDFNHAADSRGCEKFLASPASPSLAEPPANSNRALMRKPMKSKLLELARWHASKEISNANGVAHNAMASALKEEKDLEPAQTVAPRLRVELLSTEDIYRSAGILNLRGYGIHKVVEMLRNQHICALSNEMKRAAILMALDSASIALDQVLRDAKARQEALDSYESDQRKQFETEWSRRTEENRQLAVELERIKEQYMARIARNQESIERERATFNAWLTAKQRESESIAEAAELCRGGGEAKVMTAAATQA